MKVKEKNKEKIKSLAEIFLIIAFFIISSYIIQKNIETIGSLLNIGFFGLVFYVIIVVIAIVIAPVSAIPLIPLASQLWGWVASALLNITGWVIGATIAFVLARKYGTPLVSKFIKLEKIKKIEQFIPQKNVFWSLVFLRMIIPVDILSYALGLFSQISLRKYFLATLIGVTPFAFVFAYVGFISFRLQIIALAIALLIVFLGFLVAYYRKKKV